MSAENLKQHRYVGVFIGDSIDAEVRSSIVGVLNSRMTKNDLARSTQEILRMSSPALQQVLWCGQRLQAMDFRADTKGFRTRILYKRLASNYSPLVDLL